MFNVLVSFVNLCVSTVELVSTSCECVSEHASNVKDKRRKKKAAIKKPISSPTVTNGFSSRMPPSISQIYEQANIIQLDDDNSNNENNITDDVCSDFRSIAQLPALQKTERSTQSKQLDTTQLNDFEL